MNGQLRSTVFELSTCIYLNCQLRASIKSDLAIREMEKINLYQRNRRSSWEEYAVYR